MKYNLKTDRLSLQEINKENFDFIITLETRVENKQYEMGHIPKSENIIKNCEKYIEASKKLPQCGAIKYVVSNDKNELVGTVSLRCNWERTKEWELGYIFLKEYWGNGYATESVKKVIEFAFKELGIHKLMAFVNAENKRGVSLAKRVGMVNEGEMREARLIDGKWNDECVFTLLKSDLKYER